MKTLLLVLLLLPQTAAAGVLRVVATTPELADIVSRVGGPRVKVESIARGGEDIHQVVMRPSLVPALNRADAVVYLGMGVEHTFLPGLLGAAANPRLRADPVMQCAGPGCVDCSEGISVLLKPATLSRAEGELHPFGNPHYNLDPESGAVIARNVATALARLDPDGASDYEAGRKAYSLELEGSLKRWRALVAPLRGVKAVSYHQDVPYLGRFAGIEFVGTLEPKPGVAPTPGHLQRLVELMRAEKVSLIVREQQYDAKGPQWLAEQTGARVAVIGTMSKSLPGTETFVKLVDRNLAALVEAAGGAK